MKVEVVDASVWAPELREQKRRLSGPDLGTPFLNLCHSSGLAVPVKVPYDFADWLNGGGFAFSTWDHLLPDPMLGRAGLTRAQALATLLRDPFHAARLALFPACAHVQAQSETIQIFHKTGRRSPISEQQSRFDRRLEHLLTSEDIIAQGHRTAIALRLIQYVSNEETRSDAVPAPDTHAAALFLAASNTGQSQATTQKIDPSPEDANTRISHRLQSDGIEGIRHASPTEDPSLMVPSQLVYPGALMLEKILNEGFTAYDRPPPLPEQHQYYFAASVLFSKEEPILSQARAAFWLAARSIERDFAYAPVRLTFAWRASEAGRYDVLHHSSMRSRNAARRSAVAWLQGFVNEAAPFWSGPAAFVGQTGSADTRLPDAETLLNPALALRSPDDERSLRTHVTIVSPLGQKLTDGARSTCTAQMQGLGADRYALAELTLNSDESRFALDGRWTDPHTDSFDDQVRAVQTLSQYWRASFKKVIERG